MSLIFGFMQITQKRHKFIQHLFHSGPSEQQMASMLQNNCTVIQTYDIINSNVCLNYININSLISPVNRVANTCNEEPQWYTHRREVVRGTKFCGTHTATKDKDGWIKMILC